MFRIDYTQLIVKSFVGVGPAVRLRSYKVFGCTASSYEDIILVGALQAFEDGADVINLSLGSDQGFPDNALAVALSAIVEAGVFVAAAAGNSGTTGRLCTACLLDENTDDLLTRSILHCKSFQWQLCHFCWKCALQCHNFLGSRCSI